MIAIIHLIIHARYFFVYSRITYLTFINSISVLIEPAAKVLQVPVECTENTQ